MVTNPMSNGVPHTKREYTASVGHATHISHVDQRPAPCELTDMAEYLDILRDLIELRKAARHSQVDLSRALGVTPGAVGNWETGKTKVSVQRAVQWARVYGADLHLGPERSTGEGDDRAAAVAKLIHAVQHLSDDALLDMVAIAERFALVPRADAKRPA